MPKPEQSFLSTGFPKNLFTDLMAHSSCRILSVFSLFWPAIAENTRHAQGMVVTTSPTHGLHFEMVLPPSCDYLCFKKKNILSQLHYYHSWTQLPLVQKKQSLDNFNPSKSRGTKTSLLVAIFPISFTSLSYARFLPWLLCSSVSLRNRLSQETGGSDCQ